jgi:hypothetical protein
VHKYVWGPTHVSSLGGSRYYVTFIDDATRKTWVYWKKSQWMSQILGGVSPAYGHHTEVKPPTSYDDVGGKLPTY